MTPQEELEDLLNHAIGMASEFISEYGDFYAFGGGLNASGGKMISLTSTGEVAAEPNESGEKVISKEVEVDGDPDPEEAQDVMTETLMQDCKDGKLKAVFLCYTATTEGADGEELDVIAIDLDHAEGEPMQVCLPYLIDGDDLQLGEMQRSDHVLKFFDKK